MAVNVSPHATCGDKLLTILREDNVNLQNVEDEFLLCTGKCTLL